MAKFDESLAHYYDYYEEVRGAAGAAAEGLMLYAGGEENGEDIRKLLEDKEKIQIMIHRKEVY